MTIFTSKPRHFKVFQMKRLSHSDIFCNISLTLSFLILDEKISKFQVRHQLQHIDPSCSNIKVVLRLVKTTEDTHRYFSAPCCVLTKLERWLVMMSGEARCEAIIFAIIKSSDLPSRSHSTVGENVNYLVGFCKKQLQPVSTVSPSIYKDLSTLLKYSNQCSK